VQRWVKIKKNVERWRRDTSSIHIIAKGVKRYQQAIGIANIKGTMASAVKPFADRGRVFSLPERNESCNGE
jgi:hypothetical protein